MTKENVPKRNVRDGAVEIAKTIIDEVGLDGLSLREVARRLGVSHNAPYKHFPSRDHLLAEVIRQAYVEFGDVLRKASAVEDPNAALARMGEAYIAHGLEKPLEYRLMFGTTLPDPSVHRAMMSSADQAFDLLVEALRKLGRNEDPNDQALFVWSALHGLVTLLSSDVARAINIRHTAKSATILALHHLRRGLTGGE